MQAPKSKKNQQQIMNSDTTTNRVPNARSQFKMFMPLAFAAKIVP